MPKINLKVLNLGNVVMGEVGNSHLAIENFGAIDANFNVNIEELESEASNFTFTEIKSIVEFQEFGTLNSYTKINFPIKFRPLNPGKFKACLIFNFYCQSHNRTVTPIQLKVLIEGISSNLPIYLDRTFVDIQSCTFNKVFLFQ